MAERKKTPISTVDEDVISMEFDENHNIPSTKYSEKTLEAIHAKIAKKQKAEKLKRLIDEELKHDDRIFDGERMDMKFQFNAI